MATVRFGLVLANIPANHKYLKSSDTESPPETETQQQHNDTSDHSESVLMLLC